MSDSRPLSLISPGTCAALWARAAQEEVGIAFAVDRMDIERIRPMMYAARKEMNDPSLENIGMYIAPGQTEIWLVKKALEAP